MLIKDSFTLAAPRESVWVLLQDIERVGRCVPGVEDISRLSDDAYQGTIKVKVGPISAAFQGQVCLLERAEPEKMVAEISGSDKSSASQIKATFTGILTPNGASTRLDYEVDMALRGKLGQFGGAVIQATARKMTQEFVHNLEGLLAASSAAG
jgi:uncharacterized protein